MITTDYQIEIRHLRYFLAVAENLHFRKAAEQLYISQPGLSRQIRQMEDHLNVKLFKRHNRKVVLTRAGEYLQKEASDILKKLNFVYSHTQLLDKGLLGNLRFGYVGSAMQKVIPEMLLKIRSQYPKILFDLREMNNQLQIEKLLNDDIDIGFVRMESVPALLQKKAILKETFSLVLPLSHQINTENFVGLHQLREEQFILFDRTYSDSYFEKVMQLFRDSDFIPKVAHNTVHASSIYRLVENNFGVSIVPSSLRMGYDMKVKFIELKNIKQRTTLNLVWKKQNKSPLLEYLLGDILN